MHTEQADSVAVDVELPTALLAEIDAHAATHGYATPDAVVAAAIDRYDDRS